MLVLRSFEIFNQNDSTFESSPGEVAGLSDQKPEDTLPNPLNILICSARPAGTQDIPQRLVSRIVMRELQRLRSDEPNRKATVEIVRPGTFKALEKHLTGRPQGFYDLVHFDLHGIEDQQGK